MRLTLLTAGSRGDVQPYIALGLGLQHAGHAVRLATHAIFEAEIRARGLHFAPLEGDPRAIVQSEGGQAWLETARNPLGFARGFRQQMGPLLRRATQDALAACSDADAILCSGVGFYGAFNVAEKLGAPLLQAYLQPIHPTRAFPSAIFPTRLRGGGPFNLLSHVVGGQTFWQLMRPPINRIRHELLDLPSTPLLGPFMDMLRQGLPVLYGYSPSVLPKPPDWAACLHVVGYWFLDEPEWTPPPALADFLAAGPPVYLGFGSMADRDPARTTEIVLAALAQSGQRGLLLTGWAGLAASDLPEWAFRVERAPHDWLFPRVAAVVHHGGAGTTAAGLRAGCPTVVVPFFADQPFWGDRVHALGVGPRPIPRKELTPARLAAAIRQAVGDDGLRARAAALGQRIRAEDGVGQAVRVVEEFLTP